MKLDYITVRIEPWVYENYVELRVSVKVAGKEIRHVQKVIKDDDFNDVFSRVMKEAEYIIRENLMEELTIG